MERALAPDAEEGCAPRQALEGSLARLNNFLVDVGRRDEPKPPPGVLAPAGSSLKYISSACTISTMAPDDMEHDECGGHMYHGSSGKGWVAGKLSQREEVANVSPRRRVGYDMANGAAFAHSRVPRNQNLAEEFAAGATGPIAKPTTLMIRNVPNRSSQQELVQELEEIGFAGTFNFFYAPIDSGTMGNVGYAFVNFVDANWAAHCRKVVDGYAFKKNQRRGFRKVASVSVAHLQGLQANIRHYQNTAVLGRGRFKNCAPLILSGWGSPGIPPQ